MIRWNKILRARPGLSILSNRVSVGRSTQFPRKRYRVRVPSTRDRLRRVEYSTMVSFHDAENIQNDERSERKFNRETYFSLARELGGRPTGRFLFRTGTFSILFAVLDRRIPDPDYEYQPVSSIVNRTPNTPSCGVFVPVLLRSNPEWWRRTTTMMMTKRKTEVQPNGDQITKRLRGMTTNLTIQI